MRQRSLGLIVPPTLPTELLPRVARAVEASGLDALWVCEDCYATSAVASAAIALAATERIAVGTGFLSVPLRNVAAAAMDFGMLARTYPGRILSGIGHGHQPHMAQIGAKAASPLTLLEEYAVALRALLAGETVTASGQYVRLDGVRLHWPPTIPPPILIGAEKPKTLQLAGRIGDGAVLTHMVADDDLPRVVGLVSPEPGQRIVLTRVVAIGAGAKDQLAADPGHYPGVVLPAGSVPGLAGGADEGLRRLFALGVTDVSVSPTANEPDLFGLIEALGSEVRPRLHEPSIGPNASDNGS
ncbi:LLM class flavin-dependent oxidoreductase [Segniliparus rugosus]|uniref:Luciferase-like domain-containing protein n=1 Tax=Segniliparus rugosus (strain ATCC BAA-974 / DSM 45345 / CCUG 50838 / CIP 108380 / JCM 13579 / CDC 945) TaxID=679197 RepID=E5XQY9_SEGRC|nr:LLM class flavin-dependent oxidoreductase [Segniliparus rugosus]EFV13229.1 hypothetical protein HMPREF9336_01891 [Segniliparus rugosus ATCC BAA-974]